MNKKLCGIIVVLVIICFFTVAYILRYPKKALGERETKVSTEEKKVDSEVYNQDYYYHFYDEDTLTYSFEKKHYVEETEETMFYKKEDIEELLYKVIDVKYDLVLNESDNGLVEYLEYQNNYPTGLRIVFTIEDGYISKASYREGTAYDIDEKDMITYEEAFDIAKKSICEKYGEDTEVLGEDKDYEYEFFYSAEGKVLCYRILEVKGNINGDPDYDLNPVTFYVNVSIDGAFVEIASTLGY